MKEYMFLPRTSPHSLPRISVSKRICHGPSESGVPVYHTPTGLQYRVQQTVPSSSIPQRVQSAIHVLDQLTTPVDDAWICLKFCSHNTRTHTSRNIPPVLNNFSHLPLLTSLSTISSSTRFCTAEQNRRISTAN